MAAARCLASRLVPGAAGDLGGLAAPVARGGPAARPPPVGAAAGVTWLLMPHLLSTPGSGPRGRPAPRPADPGAARPAATSRGPARSPNPLPSLRPRPPPDTTAPARPRLGPA